MKLANDSRVEKALRRLRQMGLQVSILPEGDNEAFIFITLKSVLNLISKQMTYPNKKVYYEEPFIVIDVWRTPR